jgi:hypothetical protein
VVCLAQLAKTTLVVGVVALLVALNACLPTDPTAPPVDAARAALLVRADLSGTTVATVVVEVTAPDIPDTLVFNIPNANGVASGTIGVPTGSARHIKVRAFDAGGVEADSGSVTVAVRPGVNPIVAIVLMPLAGSVPITVTLGSFAIMVSPPVRGMVVGDTLTVTATILDAGGNPVTGQVVWASFTPGVATIVSTGQQTGRITAVGVGPTMIVGAFGGTAGSATVIVYTPPESSWTHEPEGLIGIADRAGNRDHDFALQDVNGAVATTSGWFNPYPADYADGQLALITDSVAPYPNSVVQVTYPLGWNVGAAPGEVDYSFPQVREFYLGFYFKISKPYQGSDSGHNKIFYLYSPATGVVFEFHQQGSDWIFFMADYISNPGFEVDHYGTARIEGGIWYKVELVASYSNGLIAWWVNGALDRFFPVDLATNAGGGLNRIQLSPTYGGGGAPAKTEVDYVWYNHIHMTGLP